MKRYLMHNQGDSEDPKLNEIDEMKQEVQMIKYEILQDIKKFREENFKSVFFLNNNLQYVTEEFLHKYKVRTKGSDTTKSCEEFFKSSSICSESSNNEENKPQTVLNANNSNIKIPSSTANSNELKSLKSLRRFRELCYQNKKMLKSITAFSHGGGRFENVQVLKSDQHGKLSHQNRSFSETMLDAENNVSNKRDSYVGRACEKFYSCANSKTNVTNLEGSGGRGGDGKVNGIFFSASSQTMSGRDSMVEITIADKNKLFEEFQNRLDFDLQIPYEGDY